MTIVGIITLLLGEILVLKLYYTLTPSMINILLLSFTVSHYEVSVCLYFSVDDITHPKDGLTINGARGSALGAGRDLRGYFLVVILKMSSPGRGPLSIK